MDRAGHRIPFSSGAGFRAERTAHFSAHQHMSEEVLFVFGLILAAGVAGYLLLGGAFSMKLTSSQIAIHAMQAGFSGDDVITAVAIALAESNGDPNAQGDFIGGQYTSYGLWQIHWTVHPEVGPPANLFDPQANANAAYTIFREQGFAAWTTYKTGAYSAHLADATAGASA